MVILKKRGVFSASNATLVSIKLLTLSCFLLPYAKLWLAHSNACLTLAVCLHLFLRKAILLILVALALSTVPTP